MPSTYNHTRGKDKGNRQSQQTHNYSMPSAMQYENADHSEQLPLSTTSPGSAQRPWQYTSIDNVKAFYNSQDAQDYIRNMARTLEISNLEGSSDFIHEMLQRVDRITKPTDAPFEYWYNGPHEKCYILVLIETKETRIDIGYSYHSITDALPLSYSADRNMILPGSTTFDWFRARARESLKIPAAIVGHLTRNEAAVTEFRKQQLPQSSEQRSNGKLPYNNQKDYSMNHHPPLEIHDDAKTMSSQDGSTTRTRQRDPR